MFAAPQPPPPRRVMKPSEVAKCEQKIQSLKVLQKNKNAQSSAASKAIQAIEKHVGRILRLSAITYTESNRKNVDEMLHQLGVMEDRAIRLIWCPESCDPKA